MKSVLIISVVTFFLIFGGLAVLSGQLSGKNNGNPPPVVTANALDVELVMKGLDAERSLLRREKEELVILRQAQTVQGQVLTEGRKELSELVRQIEAKQGMLNEDRERSAVRLAKMYENMKPQQAAPIMSALDMEIILDIMGRMKEREAARILANMDAGLAARISTELSIGGSS